MIELHYSQTPSNKGALLASLLARRPALAVPDKLHVKFHATWTGARVDPKSLRDYMALTESEAGPARIPSAPAPHYASALPLLYVHAMAMPLHMAIMAHASFPIRLLGLVHWANQTESLQPIAPDATLDFECLLDGITASERGQMFEIHTIVRVQGEIAWRETSTFLAPAKQKKSAKGSHAARADEPAWDAPIAEWSVAANAGRKFAGPSGDWNPIHVSAFTAKLFGYPRAIAHGMFSAARCLSLLQTGKPQTLPVRLDLRFKRPLLIPGSVALHTAATDGATQFVLRVQPSGEPHIEGRLSTTA
jgi:acyl dehydratase